MKSQKLIKNYFKWGLKNIFGYIVLGKIQRRVMKGKLQEILTRNL